MDRLKLDVRHAIRTLTRQRGFAFVAVLVLAIGIGANTAVFSVANAFLFRPPPWHEPDELSLVTEQRLVGDPIFPGVSFADFEDWQAQARSFSGMAYFTWTAGFNVAGGREPVRTTGSLVSHELFPLLGVRPLLGRVFDVDDDRAGAEPTVILTASLWEQQFDADPGVVGTAIRIDGTPHTVIGVMPRDVVIGGNASFWLPIRQARPAATLLDREQRARNLVVVRRAAGVDDEAAEAELRAIAARLAESYPQTNRDIGVDVTRMQQWLSGEFTGPVSILLGVVAFVLLIACANLATLMLARAPLRAREMALRSSIGASRAQLVRLLLTESALIAAVAGVVGLLLASWGVDLIEAALPGGFGAGRLGSIQIDGRVLAFTAMTAAVASIAFGALPALQTSRADLNAVMKRGGAGGGGRIQYGLVVAEIALTVVLLAGAGLLLKNLLRFRSLELGFEPDRVLTFSAHPPEYAYPDAAQLEQFRVAVLDRLRVEPDAEGVAVETRVEPRTPFDRGFGFTTRTPLPAATDADPPLATFGVSESYFEVKRIGLERGRFFTSLDRDGAPRVALVNAGLAARIWPGANPIGQEIRLGDVGSDAPWWTVVGVIQDVRQPAHTELTTVPFTIYFPIAQTGGRSLTFYVRTRDEPARFIPAARRAVASVDEELPITAVRSLDDMLYVEAFDRAALATLVNLFATVALALAVLGLYGVIRFTVGQRTREIAIRIGLGARGRDVNRLILAYGARITVAGAALGLAGAWALTRVIAAFLDDVSPTDPLVLGSVVALLSAVALLACWVPARHANRIQPMDVLRSDG